MNTGKELADDMVRKVRELYQENFAVRQHLKYAERYGVLRDYSVFQGPPFTDKSSIVDIFTDITLRFGICAVIERINAHAAA